MSLINDALKRASQSHREESREAATSARMEPVRTPQKTSNLPLVAGVLIALALIVAGLFLWQWSQNGHRAEVIISAAPALPPKAEITPVAVPDVLPVISPAPVISTPTKPPVAPVALTNAPPPEPTFPALSLKAIIYRQKNPLVIINAKTMGVGDEIDGARVEKIYPKKVIVIWNGQRKELLMD